MALPKIAAKYKSIIINQKNKDFIKISDVLQKVRYGMYCSDNSFEFNYLIHLLLIRQPGIVGAGRLNTHINQYATESNSSDEEDSEAGAKHEVKGKDDTKKRYTNFFSLSLLFI